MLFPIIYFGKNHSAKLRGKRVLEITCEKCGHRFDFSVLRVGQGFGTSPYLLDEEGAENRAKDRAKRRLDEALEYALEPRRCPQCNWLQTEMVQLIRQRSFPGFFWGFAIGLPIVLGIALWFVLFVGTDLFQSRLQSGARLPAVLLLAGIGSSLSIGWGLRNYLKKKIDPNLRWSLPRDVNPEVARDIAERAGMGPLSIDYATENTSRPVRHRPRWVRSLYVAAVGVICTGIGVYGLACDAGYTEVVLSMAGSFSGLLLVVASLLLLNR